jgi:hypothetical protein
MSVSRFLNEEDRLLANNRFQREVVGGPLPGTSLHHCPSSTCDNKPTHPYIYPRATYLYRVMNTTDVKKPMRIPKWYSNAVNWERTDNIKDK